MHLRTTAIVTVLAGALGGLGTVGCCSASDHDVDYYLGQQSFTPFATPNQDIGPGAVITVDENGVMKEKLCSPAESVGAAFQPVTSNTEDIQSVSECGGGIKVSATILNEITLDASFSDVTDVTVDLSNAEVLSIDGSELDDDASKFRTPSCTSEIEKQLAAKQNVVVVMSVYQADYTLTVSYDTSVSADVQAKLTDEIAAKIGITFSHTGTDTISGKSLFWGYKSLAATP